MRKARFGIIEYILIVLLIIALLLMIGFGITFSTLIIFLFILSLIFWDGLRRFQRSHKWFLYFYKIMNVGYLLFLVSFLIVQLLIHNGITYETEEDDYDYILVLGAGLRGQELSTILRLRLELAVDLAAEEEEVIYIVSGGQGPGEDIPEALAMSLYLSDNGVNPDRIILEDMSTSTQENIEFSKSLVDVHFGEKSTGLLITNEFHMFRALELADREGLLVKGLACKTPLTIRLNYLIREYFTIINSLVLGKLSMILHLTAKLGNRLC